MLKKFLSHTFLYALGPQIPRFINILILPVLTEYLTPLDYGVYGTITAYVGMIGALQSLGFPVLLVNSYYNKSRWKIYWRQYYGILLAWSLVYTMLLGVLLYFVVPQEAISNRWYIVTVLCTSALFLNVTVMIGGRLFQLEQKPSYIATSSAIGGIVTICMNYHTIVNLRLGYMGWYISTLVGVIVVFLFYVFPLIKKYALIPIFKYRGRFLKESLSVSLPTIPHEYSVYLLNSSDRMIMDTLDTNIKDIGNYNMAYTFGNYIEIIGTAVGMAVGPYYAKLWSAGTLEAKKESRLLTYFLQISFIIGTFSVAIWIKEIFQLLISNDELKKAYPFAVIIIMGYAYRPMYWSVVNKLFYEENTRVLWKISFVAGILNVFLNLIFIPKYGVIAAPITTFVSLMYIGFSGYFLKAYQELDDVSHHPIIWLVIIIQCTVAAYFIVDMDWLVKLEIMVVLIVLSITLFLKNIQKLNLINLD